MKNLTPKNLIIALLLSFSTAMFGQLQLQTTTNASANNLPVVNKPYYMYIFPSDSIQGFDQNNTNQEALARKCFGVEYHMFNYWEKRRFINQKYNLTPSTVSNPTSSSYNARPIISQTMQVNAAPCVNEGFESSPATVLSTAAAAINNVLTGWQVTNANTMLSPYNNCTSNLVGAAGCAAG